MTPVFLSWSGARSDRLATAIQRLLAALAPELPTHRSADLAKGEPWSEGLLAQLRGSVDVLICVTPEALASTWITYEAGFIYGSTDKARVFTILFEVEPTDVPGPLQQFQSTRLVESDVRRLVAAIAGSDAAGDQWGGAWENFAADVAEIPPLLLDEIEPEIERWFRRKTFDEPVDQCIA